MTLKLTSETKNISELLQEEKKHLVIPETILSDLNKISDLAGVNQQRISTEILKAGLPRVAKKYHLITNSK